jgi:hypothetical protein
MIVRALLSSSLSLSLSLEDRRISIHTISNWCITSDSKRYPLYKQLGEEHLFLVSELISFVVISAGSIFWSNIYPPLLSVFSFFQSRVMNMHEILKLEYERFLGPFNTPQLQVCG